MTVYADVLFFVNFIFDAEILIILLKLYSKKIPHFRFLLSTCIGGMQGIFVFIPYFRVLCSPPARFLMPLIMTFMVFAPCRIGELLGAWISFLAISFVISGAVTFFNLRVIYGLLMLVPVYIMLLIVKRNIKSKKSMAILVYGNKKTKEEGMFDSGNALFYRQNPVMLANESVFKNLFGSDFSVNAATEWVDAKDVCFVPYTSLGDDGAVFGIRLEYAIINGKRYDDVILGYSGDKFKDNLILNSTMT